MLKRFKQAISECEPESPQSFESYVHDECPPVTDELKSWESENDIQRLLLKSGFRVEEIDSHGGYEGSGEKFYKVLKVTDVNSGESINIKMDGWYQSYSGSELDGSMYTVEKVEVKAYEWRKA